MDDFVVKSYSSKVFDYVSLEKRSRRFFCLQQSLLTFIWMIYFKNDPLNSTIEPGSPKHSFRYYIRWLRKKLGRVRRNAEILALFTQYKLGLKKTNAVVKLPFDGHICVAVHKGHKIFDLDREKVIKVFDSMVTASSVSSEIEKLTVTSKLDFAPSLSRWSIDEKWYEEDYVCGLLDSSTPLVDSDDVLRKFCDECAPLLYRVMLCQSMVTKNSEDYLENLTKILDRSEGLGEKIRAPDLRRVKAFIDNIIQRLEDLQGKNVQLVFSHGDFIPNNILHTKNGMRVIDWEDATYRSALFDFYSYFFYRPTIRSIPVSLVVSEVDHALPFFVKTLSEHAPEISASLSESKEFYRWMFYVELICRLVERDLTEKRLDIADYLSRYLDAFADYEKVTSVR